MGHAASLAASHQRPRSAATTLTLLRHRAERPTKPRALPADPTPTKPCALPASRWPAERPVKPRALRADPTPDEAACPPGLPNARRSRVPYLPSTKCSTKPRALTGRVAENALEPAGRAGAEGEAMMGRAKVSDEVGAGGGEAESAFGLDEAAAAFEALRGELEAAGNAEVPATRVDMQRAAAVAHGVARRDAQPARRAAFVRLAAGGFYDLATLERLPGLALAAWYARAQQLERRALGSRARVTEAIVVEARGLRSRMARVLGHWLDDRADVAALLAFVRQGAGHLDLANDLRALADLYDRADVAPVIAHDGRHYRAGDPGDARRLAHALFTGQGLAPGRDAQHWTSLAHRAFSLLSRAYEAHRRSGVYIFEASEDVARTYPALVTAARARARRATRGGVGEGGGAGEGDGARVSLRKPRRLSGATGARPPERPSASPPSGRRSNAPPRPDPVGLPKLRPDRRWPRGEHKVATTGAAAVGRVRERREGE